MRIKNFEFSKYCTPAQLYLVIGVICIISGFFANYSIEMLLTKGLFLVVWAWVLNWLCSKGFKAISWIIVLLPFVFFLFTYFLVKDLAVKEGLFGRNTPARPPPKPASGGIGAAVKPIGGAGGMQQLTPAQQAERDARAAKEKEDRAKAAADKAATEKALAEKAAADKAAADKLAKCQTCGTITNTREKNICKTSNGC